MRLHPCYLLPRFKKSTGQTSIRFSFLSSGRGRTFLKEVVFLTSGLNYSLPCAGPKVKHNQNSIFSIHRHHSFLLNIWAVERMEEKENSVWEMWEKIRNPLPLAVKRLNRSLVPNRFRRRPVDCLDDRRIPYFYKRHRAPSFKDTVLVHRCAVS